MQLVLLLRLLPKNYIFKNIAYCIIVLISKSRKNILTLLLLNIIVLRNRL